MVSDRLNSWQTDSGVSAADQDGGGSYFRLLEVVGGTNEPASPRGSTRLLFVAGSRG